MPAPAAAEIPSVSLSFANNFWGKDDAGVGPLLGRMHNAKTTCDELEKFYSTRAAIEDEYARKLLNLARKPLGAAEAGTLRLSLDVVRAEVESMAKAHQNIAAQMKTELDEPLAAFAGGMKERRKIVQTGIEKLLKLKVQQTVSVNKTRDRYEQDCLKIKGYLAQGHMVMGQEERKNKAKLEKTQLQLSGTRNEYEAAVKVLEETTGRWNRDWKAACDKFQDLEEERVDFLKSSLWTFANIASTVCVSDDASCEKIRLSLEDCDVEKDICSFIKENGTGQEIPDPPKFIDYCRGDITDTASEASEDGAYRVAQFPRPINPAIRSSSPQPSVFESHNDPNSELVKEFGRNPNAPPAQDFKPPPSVADPVDSRFAKQNQNLYQEMEYAISQAEIPKIQHDPYPPDGMTQFCRPNPSFAPPSERSSNASPIRSASRDSQSDYSNPASLTSYGPSSGAQSPVKQMTPPAPTVEDEGTVRKRGFNSPFRRRSKHQREISTTSTPTSGAPSANRNSWGASTAARFGFGSADSGSSRSRGFCGPTDRHHHSHGYRKSASPEPIDPRANIQLNVGANVFDVTPNGTSSAPQTPADAGAAQDDDPIAQALRDLNLSDTNNKLPSSRVTADRYAGLATPAPPAASPLIPGPGGRNTPLGVHSSGVAAAHRGTPPPCYDHRPASRLVAPGAAHTAREMEAATRTFREKNQNLFHVRAGSSSVAGGYASPGNRTGIRGAVARATSPAPGQRSVSPQLGIEGGGARAVSPNPYGGGAGMRQRSNTGMGRPMSAYGRRQGSTEGSSPGGMPRAVSPQPGYAHAHSRPGSSRGGGADYALQLVSSGRNSQVSTRLRSKSVADVRQYTKDGRPILHYSRAMYNYQAQIPEELGFGKGDLLAVLRLQDDGWWEAEIAGNAGRTGLVPSNYLQNC